MAGRKPLENFQVYKSGLIRLPANFKILENERLKVRWDGWTLFISVAPAGVDGLKPYRTRAGKSRLVSFRRIFRLMGLNSDLLAGTYWPEFHRNILTIHLDRR